MAGKTTGLFTASKLNVEVSLEPGLNAYSSIIALHAAEKRSGFVDWVTRTLAKLTPEQKKHNRILVEGLFGIIDVHRSWPSFGAIVKDLESKSATQLRDRVLAMLCESMECYQRGISDEFEPITPDELLSDRDLYLDNIKRWFSLEDFDPSFHDEIYDLLQDPSAVKELALNHLRSIWHEHLEREWKSNLPMLRDAVTAFQYIDLSDLSVEEVIRAVLGRDLMFNHHFEPDFSEISNMIFIPSAHVGPYAVMFRSSETMRFFFGAHLVEHLTEKSSGTSRSEMLVRLSALADNSRLQILELLKESEELYSQDVISKLGLSQSSASRHLIHLCAAGFLTERRGERGKCYAINRNRIEETMLMLQRLLLA